MFKFNSKLHPATVAIIVLSAIMSTVYMASVIPLLFGAVMLMARDTSRTFGMTMADVNPAEKLDEVVRQFAAKSSEFSTISGELRQAQQEILAKTATNDTSLHTIQKTVDELLIKFNGVNNEVQSLEQRVHAAVENEQKTAKTWGQQFVEGEQYKSKSTEGGNLSGKRFGGIAAEVKQVTSAAAGGLIRSARETDVLNLQREGRVMRDLLRTIPVNTSSVDYAVQTSRTNAAAPVAEGQLKPYSDYAWGSATVVVKTLAHLAKLTRQALDDAPRLVGEIDSEMRYGLGLVEERQFLYGTGIGQNLHGIVPQATPFAVNAAYTRNALATRVDVLRLAMLQVSLGLIPADGIVLSDVDWAMIEMTKTTDGAYLFAQPQGVADRRMWGLPLVSTPAAAVGDFLVGNFGLGATVYDRMSVEVLISTENVDDFERNLATMRAEERVAIAVKRPGAFVTGNFTSALVAARPV